MNNKILFISFKQFGYYSIYFNYCEYLKNEFEITYLCFEENFPKKTLKNVNVYYIKLYKNKLIRQFHFYKYAHALIKETNVSVVIIQYFRFCAIYKMLNRKTKIFVDVRSGYLIKNDIIRNLANFVLKLEVLFFNQILILSESLSKKLSLPDSRTTIIPLGAKEILLKNKEFSDLKLLYIGVISRRRITDTIIGLYQFIKNNNIDIKVSYDIIGYGTDNEEKELITLIQKFELQKIVIFHGRLFGDDLTRFFDECNIGIAYVPMTKGYDLQPLTKTFDYMFAGMPVIATDTSENRRIISSSNGILINDNPLSFSEGLRNICSLMNSYNSQIIKDSVKDYSWRKILKTKLEPLLVQG